MHKHAIVIKPCQKSYLALRTILVHHDVWKKKIQTAIRRLALSEQLPWYVLLRGLVHLSSKEAGTSFCYSVP